MFEFKNGSIRMYGPVGLDGGFDYPQLIGALDKLGGEDVEIRMSSVGGDVDAGFQMYNALSEYPGHVAMRIDTQAYSIASVVMLAADVVVASSNAEVMVHNAWTIALGNASDFREVADLLDRRDGMLADMYAHHTGQERDFWLGQMAAETYYSAEAAQRVGLIDGIVTGKSSAAPGGKAVAVLKRNERPALARHSAMMQARRLRRSRALR